MKSIPQAQDVLHQLTQWADKQKSVRAMLLTSTRARPNGPVDLLSDYDVILIVEDIYPFFEDRLWVQDFGEVLVSYWDAIYPDPDYGVHKFGNVIQYANGLKIDFVLWPVELLQQIIKTLKLPAALDAGFTRLVDKNGLTDNFPEPTYTAYIPSPPTEKVYQTRVEEFFSDAPYVAKCLWRDELLPAKWCLDYDMKHIYLRQMLEWQIRMPSWLVSTNGSPGKGVKNTSPFSNLEATGTYLCWCWYQRKLEGTV